MRPRREACQHRCESATVLNLSYVHPTSGFERDGGRTGFLDRLRGPERGVGEVVEQEALIGSFDSSLCKLVRHEPRLEFRQGCKSVNVSHRVDCGLTALSAQ
jgi:hypothetical protein